MANLEHVKRLKEGMASWNTWRRSSVENPDLRRADLRAADLSGVDLSRADLSGVDLSEANLRGVILGLADLSGADLSGAYLGFANLSYANLRMADFGGSRVGWTTFADVDLSVAKGLESVRHSGPSTIGIDTLYRSGGKIPEVFLRRAGVPEDFITHIRSLFIQPVQFNSCFISFSTKDQTFADRLHADLQEKGVRCWYAPEEMKGGRYLHLQTDQAIQVHDRLLLLLSKDSMKSEWVRREIAKAREREQRENRRVLFPLRLVEFDVLEKWKCLDPMTGEDHAPEIRKYFIPDFSNWKDHESYQKAFDGLRNALKAEKQ